MKKIQLHSWWSNLLNGVLATAIGVGLTFEVNKLVERHNQQEAQRQAAMMAIYDIDELARKFEICKAREDAFFHVAMYLFAHPEEMATTSMDSLWMTSEYLHYDPATTPEWYDESTEKVFTTSMDAMVHLGDIAFYRNVQECYHLRRNLMNLLAQSATFHHPISDEFITEYRKQLSAADMGIKGMMEHDALVGFVQLMFRQPEVELYLQKYHSRNDTYELFLEQIKLLNQENKFIMNISEQEMKRYVQTHINKLVTATPKRLAGEWEHKHAQKTLTYNLRKDRTVIYTMHTEMQMGLHVHEEDINMSMLTPLVFSAEGQWDLQNDSLIVQFDSATVRILTFDPDLSCLPKSYLDSHRDSLEIQKNDYREKLIQSIKMGISQPEVHQVSVSKTGNIMFWEDRTTMPWGEIHTDKTEFIKLTD